MIFDCNAWLGHWPFRQLKQTTPEQLLAQMDEYGFKWAAVSSLDAILHRNTQPANELLAQATALYADRLFPLAAINPTYVKWEDDLTICQERLGMKGVRLYPQYHNYELADRIGSRVAAACRERGLPVFLAHRIEDPRQRHALDPGKTVAPDGLVALLNAVPGLKVVLNNARIDPASRLFQGEYAEQPWYFDLALSNRPKEIGDVAITSGHNHMVVGTHTPLSYPTCTLVKLAVLEIDAEQRAAVEHGNAENILGLKLA